MTINKKLMLAELEAMKPSGIVSIFWMTATKARTKRIAHLEKTGVIVRQKDHQRDAYPYCVFAIKERLIDH